MKMLICQNRHSGKVGSFNGSFKVRRTTFFASGAEDHALNSDELETHNLGALGEEHIAPTTEGGENGLKSGQLVDWVVNGTRKGIQRVNPLLLTESFKTGLKKRMKQMISREHMKGHHHHYRLPNGFFSRMKHRIKRAIGGEVSMRLDEHFGGGEEIATTQTHASVNVLGPLTAGRRGLVQEFLTRKGIPLPPVPTPVPRILRGRRSSLIQQTLQLANAPAATIELMREELKDGDVPVFPPANDDIFRPHTENPPRHAIDFLIESKRQEAESKEFENSTAINNPLRLGKFLNRLKTDHEEVYNLMVKDILKEHQLDTLTSNVSALRLLRYLEIRMGLGATGDELKEALEKVKKNMPKLKEKKEEKKEAKEGEKSEEKEKAESEKLKAQKKKFDTTCSRLSDAYVQAVNKGKQVFDANLKLINSPPTRSVKESNDLNAIVERRENEKEKLLKEIQGMESEVLVEAMTLFELLKGKDKEAATHEKIKDFYKAFIAEPPQKSTEEQLFGVTQPRAAAAATPAAATPAAATPAVTPAAATPAVTPAAATPAVTSAATGQTYVAPGHGAGFSELIVRKFDAKALQTLSGDIENAFQKKFEKGTKYDCFELHVALRELDAEAKDTHTPGERRREAIAAVMMDETNARLIDVDRSTNREMQEWLASGKLTRAKQWLKARLGLGKMQTGRRLIDHISGFDKDFAMFRGMRADITEDELINLIDRNGGISDEKLFEFQKKLMEVFNGFEMLHHGGKVDLIGLDAYDMQRLIHTIAKVSVVRWTRSGCESVFKKDGNPAENTVLMFREKRKKLEEVMNGINESIGAKGAEWKKYFDMEYLKKKFYNILQGKWKDKKTGKMSDKEFIESLENDGHLTVYEAFKNVLYAKEVFDITTGVAKKTGAILAVGAGGLAAGTGGVLSSVYRKGLKPGGGAVVGAGKRVAGTAGRGIKWAMGKAKYAAFPLVLAGGILGSAWAWSKKPWVETGHSGGTSASGGGHH